MKTIKLREDLAAKKKCQVSKKQLIFYVFFLVWIFIESILFFYFFLFNQI